MAENEREVALTWQADMRFEGGGPDGPVITIDGDGSAGPSPMQSLLLAAAGCTGSDIVLILNKMRVALTTLRVEVVGTRRSEEPRRYVKVRFRYVIGGDGIDETKARRAIDLSLEKYCSVLHSLAPDIETSYELALV